MVLELPEAILIQNNRTISELNTFIIGFSSNYFSQMNIIYNNKSDTFYML